MKIGIVSDSHDNIWNLEKAVNRLKEQKIEALIHCGDFCAPFMIAELEKAGVPVHAVFGNTDDRFLTTKVADKSNLVTLHGELAELNLDGKKIAVTHFPEFGFALACTGNYDLVLHGHTHQQREEKVNDALLINPGEIMGRKGRASYAVYDTKKAAVEFFEV